MKEQNTPNRIAALDYVRAAAIAIVVYIHAVEIAFPLNLDTYPTYSPLQKILYMVLFIVGRLGAPLFFFLSGYLLLDREFDREKTIRFYKNNFVGLLVTTQIWLLIYYFFRMIMFQKPFDLLDFVLKQFFIKNTDMGHMWYMPAILGLYLFLPFVAKALQHIDIKLLKYPLLIAFVYKFFFPVIQVLLHANKIEILTSLPNLDFSGGCYGIMLLMGYLYKKGCFTKIKTYTYFITAALCLICIFVLQWYSYAKGVKYNVWYDNGFLVIASLCFFALIMAIPWKPNKLVTSLSICSFGIYLVHFPIKILLAELCNFPNAGIRFLVVFLVPLLSAWLIVWLISKCKPVAKWFLFTK